MTERVNRHDLIVNVAGRLFMEQGYGATSVREIAAAVGCTEAALYYHFKGGKRELLQAVVSTHVPDLVATVESCRDAQSLYDVIVCFTTNLRSTARTHMVSKLRWVISEFPNLDQEERALIYQKHLLLRRELGVLIRPFVETEDEVNHITWQLLFVMFGYGQLMISLEMEKIVDLNVDDFINFLATTLAAGH